MKKDIQHYGPSVRVMEGGVLTRLVEGEGVELKMKQRTCIFCTYETCFN